MSTNEKILTLHPAGKNGVNISKEKYDLIKEYICLQLKAVNEMTYQDLSAKAIVDLSSTFEGKVGWYVVSVKLDLEARNIIDRIPKTSPHKIRLVN